MIDYARSIVWCPIDESFEMRRPRAVVINSTASAFYPCPSVPIRGKNSSRRAKKLIVCTTEEQHGTGPVHFAGLVGGTLLEIYPLRNDEAADKTTRIGFTVEDVGLVLKSLCQRGLSPQTEARQSEWGLRAVVKDPDGRAVELCQ